MTEGFLGRWAQRKADSRQGKPLVEPEAARVARVAPQSVPTVAERATPADVPADPAPLTLQDAQALGQDSDFKPFIAHSVDPAVRNAAMKKLFADPHYNVMDGLDTYIDDYSQPDPLPLSMLKKMASAQFLKLVEPEEGEDPAGTPVPNALTDQSTTTITRDNHADTDMRLQQDHAPGAPDAGAGTH